MSDTDFQPPSLESINSLLPAYEFSEIMASNELGGVYFANQKSLDRQVALKLFSPALASDEKFKNAFEKSAQAVGGLRHPNLIGFIDSGTVEGMPYAVMEFVPGKSLARSTSGKLVEFSQSMAIIKGVCEGIAYAHENDLVHGSLDMMNILLNQKAEPKIGNFGLSRSVHTGADSESPEHFVAPEVLAGNKPTKASDLYSIAAIFYELITGQPYGPSSPPASTVASIPATVDKVIAKAGAVDPIDRMDDVNEFLSMLKKATGITGPKTGVTLKAAAKKTEGKTGAPASGGNRPAAAASSVSSGAKPGVDSNLLLKVVVIIILLVAVQQLYSYLQVAKKDRDLENKKIVEERKAEKEKALAEAKEKMRKEMEERQSGIPEKKDPLIPVIPERFETPMESLDRLRSALSSGRYSELPVGSIEKEGRGYFLVTKPMTWPDAVVFAGEYGASLALPNVDLSWLPDELTKDRGFWVGAGRSGTETFTLVDGNIWSPTMEVSGKDLFVYMDADGSFKTGSARKIQPFVIQWDMDGPKPLKIETLLGATGASIKSGSPVFPPGTIEVGVRRYLHVPREATWEDAQKMAQSAGGNLVVISSEEEAAQVDKITDDLKASPELWTGGYLKDDLWFWLTGEPWRGAEWINDRNATRLDSAMVIRPGRGRDAMKKSDEASGFIIEWSDDPSTNKGSSGENPAAAGAVGELTAKAKGLVVGADNSRTEALEKNIKKLTWDLNALTKNMARGEQAIWVPVANDLIGCVKDDRLWPVDVVNAGVLVSPEMDRLLKFQVRKQEEADEEFAKAAEAVRKGYLEKLKGIHDEAKAAGQIKIQKDAMEMTDKAKSLEGWVKGFGIVLKPESPKVIPRDFDNDRFERRRRDFDNF